MGRWTPLILMAGGLAILLGTLLGINFPMGVQSASVPNGGRTSKVLPANINVNSTAAGRNNSSADENKSSVAQNNNTATKEDSTPDTENTSDTNSTESQSLNAQATDTPSNDTGSNNQPIRALW
jgi:cytoskeletal protein RodZ